MGKWRAIVLILVHAAIAAHIVQWLSSGLQTGQRRTISPVEPSESMFTLELGELNAGFVFFAAALLCTLFFGRWFCGWACHVVALQDCCAWLMRRIGIHPKPWRSRLLMWVPLGLGLYMFVWPSARRALLEPVLNDWLGYVPAWIGTTAPLHGFTSEFIVEDFWKTFAPWHVAIPFLFVCGFLIVYLLGSKAFCTYGCPYGGFFGPVDRLSPVRIRVNDDCNHCGHCTAVCTSNVRVSDEVRDFGMVVDPGCFKCLDCVSVCPNDALRVGVGAPAIFARPRVAPAERAVTRAQARARFDLSLAEEIGLAVVFLVLFRGFRGMPFLGEQVPLLMAVGIAAVGAFMVHKTWRLARDLHVRAPRVQLKRSGRVTFAGWMFALCTLGVAALGLQGAATWIVITAAEGHAARLDALKDESGRAIAPTFARVYAPGYTPDPRAAAIARQGLAWLALVRPPWTGGVSVFENWDAHVRAAWLHAVTGDPESARRSVAAASRLRSTEEVVLGEARLTRLAAGAGKSFADDPATLDAVEAVFQRALARDPDLYGVRFELASLLAARGKTEEALSLYEEAASRTPGDVRLARDAATVMVNVQQPARAIAVIRRALAERPRSAALLTDLASLLLMTGKSSEGRTHAESALRLRPDDPQVTGRLAECLVNLGRPREALDLAEHALSRHPRDIGAIRNAAGLASMTGNAARALEVLRAGADRVPTAHFLRAELAGLLEQMGRNEEAIAEIRRVVTADPRDSHTWLLVSQLARNLNQPEIERLAGERLAAMGVTPPDATPPPGPSPPP